MKPANAGSPGKTAVKTERERELHETCLLQVAMRALGFEAKKTDVLKILKDCDHQSTGKIVFSDFEDVSKCQFVCCKSFLCLIV